jgi:GT2 family glycosyltransferase
VPPCLTIVIPSHQRADLLRRCLASVCRYAPANTEILVVDDASPNHIVTHTAHEFAGVRVLQLAHRRGFCAAVNAGIRAASNPIVELLNDDTEVTASWAESALAHFANPCIAAVAPLVLRGFPPSPATPLPRSGGEGRKKPPSPPLGGEGLRVRGEEHVPIIDSAGDRYFLGGIAGKRGHGQPLSCRYLQGGEVFGASASSAFYRRQGLLDVGGFPEEFDAYFEDVDVAFRLHWAGQRIVYEPASRVWHRVSASHGRPTRRLLEQQSRNEERVFWRNLPLRDLLRALPWHAAVLAAKAIRRWRHGELLPFVLGRLRAFSEIMSLVRHRRRLPRRSGRGSAAAWGVEARFWGVEGRLLIHTATVFKENSQAKTDAATTRLRVCFPRSQAPLEGVSQLEARKHWNC